jgi:hypothetical protein
MDKYYEDFGLTKIKDKEWLQKQELHNLFKRPQKRKSINTPHFNQTYAENVDHQADLLFLPNDNGYKYALVVTDLATRISDAEPLKNKTANDVKSAFETIYDRGILKLPEFIYTDPGTEFKGAVKKYFEDNDVSIKYGKAGRHSQIALVERTNQYLAKAIFRRMQAQEILTGQKSVEWVDDLPKFIKAMNKVRKKLPPKPATGSSVCSGDACKLLDIGTKVRAILDNPIDYVSEKKLHGKFRITDIRWDPQIRIIKDIILLPGRPPIYLLNDIKNINKIDNSVGYTKEQLQVIPKDEEAPNPKVIRGKQTTYVIKKILDKKKVKGKIYYKIRWKGYSEDQDTWEPRTSLIEDVPILVEEFEERLNK